MAAAYWAQGPRPRTVLVVDGNPQWRASTCRAIGAAYPVLAATCGADAVRTAKSVRPDLIVLDVVKPGGMDGYRILVELRSDPGTRDMPVIVVSEIKASIRMGFGSAVKRRHLWQSVHAFVERSASCERLLEAVRNAIGPSVCDRGPSRAPVAAGQVHVMTC
jgi:CheY-like chemotaxis protein